MSPESHFRRARTVTAAEPGPAAASEDVNSAPRPAGPREPSGADTAQGVGPVTRRDGRHLLFVAWRDLANPRAGGSEVLVDRLADGMTARGDQVTLLCGGPAGEHSYRVIRNGGTYSQFLRAPLAYQRLRDCDLVVEVCNGMPFFAPLWSRRPLVCLVN